jgi:hypothetical protein
MVYDKECCTCYANGKVEHWVLNSQFNRIQIESHNNIGNIFSIKGNILSCMSCHIMVMMDGCHHKYYTNLCTIPYYRSIKDHFFITIDTNFSCVHSYLLFDLPSSVGTLGDADDDEASTTKKPRSSISRNVARSASNWARSLLMNTTPPNI